MDELPSRAREVLRLARPLDDCRDPEARQRVRAAVASAVAGIPLAPASPAEAAVHAPRSGLGVKLLGGMVVLSAAAALMLTQSRPQAAPLAAPRAPSPESEPGAASPPALRSQSVPAQSVPGAPRTPSVHAPMPHSSARAPGPTARQAADTLTAEVSLLRKADEALTQGDLAHARRLLRQHRARFSQPALLAEREGFETLVACAAQAPDAAAGARAFVQAFPGSMLKARVEQACAEAGEGR